MISKNPIPLFTSLLPVEEEISMAAIPKKLAINKMLH